MSDPLVIDGFREQVGDWVLAQRLREAGMADTRERECEQDADASSCVRSDVAGRNRFAAYSWGCSTLQDQTGGWRELPGDTALIVLVAPVSDWAKMQFVFSAPAASKRTYCVFAHGALPGSNPLHAAPTFAITDADLKEKLAANPVANICCDAIFDVPFYDIEGHVTIHTTIQNRPEVLDLLVWMFETF